MGVCIKKDGKSSFTTKIAPPTHTATLSYSLYAKVLHQLVNYNLPYTEPGSTCVQSIVYDSLWIYHQSLVSLKRHSFANLLKAGMRLLLVLLLLACLLAVIVDSRRKPPKRPSRPAKKPSKPAKKPSKPPKPAKKPGKPSKPGETYCYH